MSNAYTKEQIDSKLRHAEKLEKAGKKQAAIARAIGIAPSTYRRWRVIHAMAKVGGGIDAMANVGGVVGAMANVGGGIETTQS